MVYKECTNDDEVKSIQSSEAICKIWIEDEEEGVVGSSLLC